jgi:hypothetical protein
LVPKCPGITHQTIRNMNFIFSQRNKKASTIAKKFDNRFEFGNIRIDELNVEELIKLAESKEFNILSKASF